MVFTASVDGKNVQELKAFNEHLVNFSYAGDFEPSAQDGALFAALQGANLKSFVNVARWFSHIASFTDAERKAWTGAASTSAAAPAGGDDDFDLFGSDEEDDEEKKRITEERLKAYAEKKAKKPGPIAKSNIIYDVKPWDDTVDIDEIEKQVRSIEMDGLVWGAAKKVPVAFGIIKLQICCVVEDEKVSSDALEEAIMAFEDHVQSVDVVAFNKV